jgi:hypothetical protein
MNTLTLYQIAAEYREAAELLATLDVDEQTVADTLESISGDLTTKAQNIAFVVRNMEATAEAIKTAAAGMTGRAKALEQRAKNIRHYLLDNMERAGVEKIDSPYFRLSIRKNPIAVAIEDERQIPARFMVQAPPPPPVPSKTAIADALKNGEDVPGCRLVQGVRLQIG